MTKLHELLAAEKIPSSAWNQVCEETLKKFSNPANYFEGHSKSLAMLDESPANKAIEDQAREEKTVTTTVHDTLEYALELFAKAEDFQYQKNKTNQIATGTIEFRGTLIGPVPVDSLLGLEARLTKIRQLLQAIPTLDATKHWTKDTNTGQNIWVSKYPEETTKTDKQVIPIVMAAATDKHPAQVQAATKDIVVGKNTTIKRSGAATALQKAETLKTIDELLIAVKQARMRSNETTVVKDVIGKVLVDLILKPLKD
jgi:hypothetical protein